MKEEVEERIKGLAKPIVEQGDLFLVDVERKGSGGTEVWVYVDSGSGDVGLDVCSRISRELGVVLDAHDLFEGRYRLNVSSPGLSRPLSDRRQYGKNRGRKVRVKYRDGEEYEKLEGYLREVSDEAVEVETPGERKTIAFDRIVETKVLPSL